MNKCKEEYLTSFPMKKRDKCIFLTSWGLDEELRIAKKNFQAVWVEKQNEMRV